MPTHRSGRSGLSRPTGAVAIGDPVKMARAIIESADHPVAVKRVRTNHLITTLEIAP
jgi:hypothetical protein